jgi:hypothetical protein
MLGTQINIIIEENWAEPDLQSFDQIRFLKLACCVYNTAKHGLNFIKTG